MKTKPSVKETIKSMDKYKINVVKSNEMPFKRVAIGVKFQYKGATYRKIANKFSFAINPNGRSNVANKVKFARSTSVSVQ